MKHSLKNVRDEVGGTREEGLQAGKREEFRLETHENRVLDSVIK